MNRAYGILALVLGVVVGFRVVSLYLGQPDDKTMIQETLRKSLEASRRGEASPVLEALSSKIRFNDQEGAGNFGQIANFIRNQKPDLVVTNQEPIITGDEARITSPVKVQVNIPVLGQQAVTVPDVVMTFQKETGREYLLFPVKKWRLADVQAPDNLLGAMMNGG